MERELSNLERSFVESVNNTKVKSINNLTKEELEDIKNGKELEVDMEKSVDMTEEEKRNLEERNFIESVNNSTMAMEMNNDKNHLEAVRAAKIESNKKRLREDTRIKDEGTSAAHEMMVSIYENKELLSKPNTKELTDVFEYLMKALDYMFIEAKISSFAGIALGLKFIKEELEKDVIDMEYLVELIEDTKRYIYKSLEFNKIPRDKVEIPSTVKVIEATTGVRKEVKSKIKEIIRPLITKDSSLDVKLYKSAILALIDMVATSEEFLEAEIRTLIEETGVEKIETREDVKKAFTVLHAVSKVESVKARIHVMMGAYVDFMPLDEEIKNTIKSNIIAEIENSQIEKSKELHKDLKDEDFYEGCLIGIFLGTNPALLETANFKNHQTIETLGDIKDTVIIMTMISIFNSFMK